MPGRPADLAILLALLAAGMLAGCDAVLGRPGSIVLHGAGSGISPGQAVPAGRYQVSWAIEAGDDPDAVCWFELALAAPRGGDQQLAYLTATSGGTSGTSDIELEEATTVAVQAAVTDCGPWTVSLARRGDRAPSDPRP